MAEALAAASRRADFRRARLSPRGVVLVVRARRAGADAARPRRPAGPDDAAGLCPAQLPGPPGEARPRAVRPQSRAILSLHQGRVRQMGRGGEVGAHSSGLTPLSGALSIAAIGGYGRRACNDLHTGKRAMSEHRAARGKKIRDQAFGKDGLKTWDELNAICPTHARAIHEYCFGTIWDRPHLDLKTRELIVIAAAVASDCPNEVALHARGALNRGAKREEIIETILQCAPYVGFPKTNHALKAAKDVFDRWEAKKADWQAL